MKNKIKTHKATKKRFKVTAKGKVVHQKQGNNEHLRIKKSNPRKARLNKQGTLGNSTEAKKIKRLSNK